VWKVTEAYTATEFPDDETCVGYAIDVYQESINKTFRGSVNFNYLKRLMANFYEVVQRDDALKRGCPTAPACLSSCMRIPYGAHQANAIHGI
jgi:hypothetical protein